MASSAESNLKTNINGGEIEFLGLSSKFSAWGSTPRSGSYPADHEMKVRSPLRTSNAHLKVARVLDDRGHAVGFRRVGSTVHRPSGSPTPNVALEESFALDVSEDAKSVDVTLAYSKSQYVELMARPTKAGDHQ